MVSTGSARVAVAGLVALFSAGLAGGQSPGPPAQPQPPSTGMIVGQVVDADSGRPVGESVVTLMGNAGQAVNPLTAAAAARKVIADSQGRFVYRDLPKGRYNVTTLKPGYVAGNYGKLVPSGPSSAIELAEGERVLDVRIAMWKHAAITGRVADEAGEPVVAASIRVLRVGMVSGRPGFRPMPIGGTATTDDRGIFRISALDPGAYVVGVAATSTTIPAAMIEDYFRATGSARAEMQEALFAAAPTMSSPGSASNQVVGDHILQVEGRMPTPPEPGADGSLAVYTAVFYPTASRTADASVITLKSGETRAGIDMQLGAVPSARVSGRLESPDGPIGIATLFLLPQSGGAPSAAADAVATTVSDASGAFTFLGVPAGTYALAAIRWPSVGEQIVQSTVVQGPGGTSARGVMAVPDEGSRKPLYWAQQRVAVSGGHVADLHVLMQQGFRLSGKVVFEGASTPPPAQRFSIFPEATEAWLRGMSLGETTLDAEGKFAMSGVPAGSYILTVPVPTGWFVKSAVAKGQDLVDLPFLLTEDLADIVVTVKDRGARVSGAVHDRDAKADVGAGVIVFPVDPRYWVDFSSYARRIRDVRAGRDGSFALVDLPAGDYYIVAVPQAALDWSVPRLFERLSQAATRITLADGEQKTMDLRTAQVR